MALKRPEEAADRRSLRVGMHHSRNGLAASFSRFPKDVRSDHFALVLADVGQRPEAVDVADRP